MSPLLLLTLPFLPLSSTLAVGIIPASNYDAQTQDPVDGTG